MTSKRVLDVVLSLIGIVFAAPIIMIAIIIVRINSIGPGILIQSRIGREGKLFDCYKIRTMYVDTPALPTHETSASYITPIGHKLRKYKIDELPQLINVLKGDMSLVGPRPCLPNQIALIKLREEEGVLKIRPGITGLAQVLNVNMTDPKLLSSIDAEYAHERTLLGDIQIIVRTILKPIIS